MLGGATPAQRYCISCGKSKACVFCWSPPQRPIALIQRFRNDNHFKLGHYRNLSLLAVGFPYNLSVTQSLVRGWWNWQTRTLEGRMAKAVQVQVLSRAPIPERWLRRNSSTVTSVHARLFREGQVAYGCPVSLDLGNNHRQRCVLWRLRKEHRQSERAPAGHARHGAGRSIAQRGR